MSHAHPDPERGFQTGAHTTRDGSGAMSASARTVASGGRRCGTHTSGSRAGKVAELWARRKNLDHPVFDRNTGRRLHPFDFRALAFERHGFIAKETAALIRKLAHLKAAHFELDPSEETRRWYVALSCCVQRANAKILRGEAVPGRGASIPSRLLSGNRDLAVCGS